MLKSYLISLYRNIVKNKFYSFLNIAGLSVGIATAILILLYIKDERGYDKYNLKYERIYRLESEFTVNNHQSEYATVPAPLAPSMKDEIPEIEEIARLDRIGHMAYHYKENQFIESKFYIADSTVFKLFTCRFILGNPATCLVEPMSIVLTEEIADRYFGSPENAMGNIITDANGNQLKVTGIIKDLPWNTHLRFDALISMSSDPDYYNNNQPNRFWKLGTFAYILLNQNANIETVQKKFLDFYKERMEPSGKKYGVSFKLKMTPLAMTHFSKGLAAELPTGNLSYLYVFAAIAVFILLIAATNYMNMATARSANRAKEVGIRKVTGADRKQLIGQFAGESVALSIIAMIMGLLIVWLLIPDFNAFTGKHVSINLVHNSSVFLYALIITLVVGIVAGSYPAFYLSSFRPVSVLKGNLSRTGKTSIYLRKILVVIQFFIAVLMIISAFVVAGQLKFMKNSNLGFTKENMIVLEMQEKENLGKLQTFKQELLQNPGILSCSNSTAVAGVIPNFSNLRIEQENGMTQQTSLIIRTDYDFLKTWGIRLVRGRDFDKNMGTDFDEAAIINKTAAEDFGWSDDPLGKMISYGYKRDFTGGRNLKVIGVTDDFFFKSLHNELEPVVIILTDKAEDFLTCRIAPQNTKSTLDYIELKWNELYPGHPFDYNYLTERMDNMYVAEKKISTLIMIATFITIFIAILGLLGLSSFIAEQKTREIGIRKIMGASITNILGLLYKDFVILILIAFVLAAPFAWWQLNNWLDSTFIYYRPVQITTLLLAGLVALVIGLGTVSYYIVRAASRNPAETIKYE